MKAVARRTVLVAVFLLVGLADLWTVRSTREPYHFGRPQHDYYNLLIDGWLDGQLAMKVDVPEALLQLPDPYDPRTRPPGLGLHDASFYRGKYYLYFGVAPVATLMLPFRLLTGNGLPLAAAVLVFVYGGFVASAAVWLAVRRRYFPESGLTVSAGALLVLGFASLGPVLLRRPQIWELPIAAGYAFAMVALWAVFHSLHSPRRSGVWLAAAGLALGLSVGSRPTYLVATPLLLIPVILRGRAARRVPWGFGLCGLVPLAGVGALLALHNTLRFGNPLEFGQTYQFSLDYEARVRHFSLAYAGFNGWRYFFSAARWSEYFPFIRPAEVPARPEGFGGYDDVYGVLANLPAAWFALALPLAGGAGRGRLMAWIGAVVVLFAGPAVMLLGFFGSLARYELDFTPALMLLACTGALALEQRVKVAARIAWGAAALGSAVFAGLFSLQLNRLLLEMNPAGYREAAAVLNRGPALFGARPAAEEFEVRWPAGGGTRTETLLSVGELPEVDRVFLRVIDGERVQVGLVRNVMPEVVSPVLPAAPETVHRVRVTLGALLPPETHPWFAGATADEARRASRVLRLEFDGKIVVETFRRFDAVVGKRIRAGTAALGDAAHPRIGRELVAVRRIPLALREVASSVAGAELKDETLRFTVRFPRDRTGACEPLVVTGATGQGDLLGVQYLDGSRVRLIFDHWGRLGLYSGELKIDPDHTYAIEVRAPWLKPSATGGIERSGDLRVKFDDTVVWTQPVVGYFADPEEVAVGVNPIGGSTAGAAFTGELHRWPDERE